MNNVGVVIGRFQTHELHAGHLAILKEANKHHSLLILVGVCHSLGTKKDPLDFAARQKMLQCKYPLAVILPLPNQDTDVAWTALVNQQISMAFPMKSATIYFGRDSSKSAYYGPFGIAQVAEISGESAESARTHCGAFVGATAAWRAGVISAAQNRYPQVTPVVDVCVTRVDDDGIVYVVVGKRDSEPGLHRFPGGHVDVGDPSMEIAARREVFEELDGIEANNYRMLGSLKVKSKYDAADRGMMSVVFRADHVFGTPNGTDDLDEAFWVRIDNLQQLKWADSHALIALMLTEDVLKERN